MKRKRQQLLPEIKNRFPPARNQSKTAQHPQYKQPSSLELFCCDCLWAKMTGQSAQYQKKTQAANTRLIAKQTKTTIYKLNHLETNNKAQVQLTTEPRHLQQVNCFFSTFLGCGFFPLRNGIDRLRTPAMPPR